MSTLNETTAKQNQAHSLAIDNSKLDEALTHLYQSQTKINKQMVINTLTQAKVLVPIALSSEAKSNAQGEHGSGAHQHHRYRPVPGASDTPDQRGAGGDSEL